MKRVFYFVATNLAILLLLGVVLSIFGLDGHSTGGALVIAAIFGLGFRPVAGGRVSIDYQAVEPPLPESAFLRAADS